MHLLKLVAAGLLLLQALPALSQASGAVEEGRRAYMAGGCYLCHGTIGHGGVGPRLAPKPMPVEAMIAFVRHSPRSMPAYDPQLLSDSDLRRIHAYLSAMEASPAVEHIPELK